MDKSDFRVLLRRQVGYEPTVAVRFEMNEGYGELYAGPARNVSPSAMGEQTDVTGEELRAGRFVHVLSSGRRRQSYALSRLDDDRLLRLPDDRWTELNQFTEFGIRYLEFPDLGPNPQVAVIQVSPGDPPTPPSPRPSPVSSLPPTSGSPAPIRAVVPTAAPPARSSVTAAAAAPAPPAAPPTTAARVAVSATSASSSAPQVTRSSSARPAEVRAVEAPRSQEAARPAPAAKPASENVKSGNAESTRPRVEPPVAVERGLAQDAVARLSADELRTRLLAEMAKVRATLERVSELERQLGASRAREADLLEVLTRWQERG